MSELDKILEQNPQMGEGDQRPYGGARVWEDGARFCYQQLHDAGWRPIPSEADLIKWCNDILEQDMTPHMAGLDLCQWLLGE